MSTSKKKLVYPYRWCSKQVNAFVEKYPRATYLFGKAAGISAGEVRHYLTLSMARGNSVQFEAFKRAIKMFADYTIYDLAKYSPKDCKALLKSIVVMAQDDELDAREARDLVDNAQQKRLI